MLFQMPRRQCTCAAATTVLASVTFSSAGWGQEQGSMPISEPSLTISVMEQPLEPGDMARLYNSMVPRSDLQYEKQTMEVLGTEIAYVDEGEGKAIVFLHGAPESIYVWRNIMPYLQPYGRIVAFDLPGHGDSGKPDIEYTFSDYQKYVGATMDALDLGDDVVLVVHDWGSVLGFDWASRNDDRVAGIAMMEALIAPFYPISDVPEAKKRMGKAGAIEHYELYQGPDARPLAIDQNLFVEEVMQLHSFRELSQREMNAYRDPFRKPEDRLPLYMWAREVSLEGNRPKTDVAMNNYNEWMLSTDTQFLDIYGYPGEVTEEYDVQWRVARVKNIETAFVGTVLHFVQEDEPVATGRAIADWYRRHFAADSTVWFTEAQP